MKKLNCNVILNLLVIYSSLLLTTSVMRILMAKSFIPQDIDEGLSKMYFYGFLYDNRILSIVILGYLLFFTLFNIGGGVWRRLLSANKSDSPTNKLIRYFLNFYIFLVSFLILLSCFINYYYFELYKSKIDVFIFGLKDDDTKAVLGVIFSSYPVFWILLSVILFSLTLVFINNLFLKARILYKGIAIIALYVIILIALIIGVRGSLSTFPLREDDNTISPFAVINHLATNPILSFFWALKHYKNDYIISKVSKSEFEALAKKAFPIHFKTNTLSDFTPPHIVVNLMESFGSHLLIYEDSDFDVLGRLKPYFMNFEDPTKPRSDFSFFRFIPSGAGTAPSFNELYLLSPSSAITQGKNKHILLKNTPIDVYKKAGYEVIFITSGNGSWQNLKEYLTEQGVDKVLEMNYFIAKYPKAKDNISSWGTLDEVIYDEIMDILEHSPKPTFIFTLTTSNHPPFKVPSDFKQIKLKNEVKDIVLGKYSSTDVVNTYAYSLDSFGNFLKRVKASSFKDKVIIAATGDHWVRDLKMPKLEYSFLSYAVPLYMYVPLKLQESLKKNGIEFSYNPLRVGSHKDIFPTLYNLSLSNTPYFSLGGRNMLSPANDESLEFGMHAANAYINDEGFIQNNYIFKWQKNDFKSLEDIVLNEAKSSQVQDTEFKGLYDRLNKMQLDLRLQNNDLSY